VYAFDVDDLIECLCGSPKGRDAAQCWAHALCDHGSSRLGALSRLLAPMRILCFVRVYKWCFDSQILLLDVQKSQ
jgi:hypothetical protein